MKYTTHDDLAARLPWRLESLTAAEITDILRVREKRAYMAGFEDGRIWRQQEPLRTLRDWIAEFELKVRRAANTIWQRISRWIR